MTLDKKEYNNIMWNRKQIIALLLAYGIFATIILYVLLAPVNRYNDKLFSQQVVCPSGSYDAGGFCKQEPTGCPYGDSIPMDNCQKFTPQESQPITTQQDTVTETQTGSALK